MAAVQCKRTVDALFYAGELPRRVLYCAALLAKDHGRDLRGLQVLTKQNGFKGKPIWKGCLRIKRQDLERVCARAITDVLWKKNTN